MAIRSGLLIESYIGIPIQIVIFLLAFPHTDLGVPVLKLRFLVTLVPEVFLEPRESREDESRRGEKRTISGLRWTSISLSCKLSLVPFVIINLTGLTAFACMKGIFKSKETIGFSLLAASRLVFAASRLSRGSVLRQHNLVPRSHSVTGNVRSGKVRQYTIFHWLLKKGCGNAIYASIGLFRGALSEGLVFASSCAVLSKCQFCGGKFCFFRRRKASQLRKII